MLPICDCRQVEVACPQDFRSLLLMKCSPMQRCSLLATQMAVWGCQAVLVWCLGTARSWERCSRRGTRATTRAGRRSGVSASAGPEYPSLVPIHLGPIGTAAQCLSAHLVSGTRCTAVG